MSPGRGRVSRRQLVLGAGAGLLAAGCGADPSRDAAEDARRAARRDAAVLGRALELERGLVAAYAGAGAALGGVARDLLEQEREHARALEDAIRELGGPLPASAVPVPAGERDGLRAALALEERALAVYAQAVSQLAEPARRARAAAILTSEAGHAAVLRAALGLEPVPAAFVP